jgi:hypothetical protein
MVPAWIDALKVLDGSDIARFPGTACRMVHGSHLFVLKGRRFEQVDLGPIPVVVLARRYGEPRLLSAMGRMFPTQVCYVLSHKCAGWTRPEWLVPCVVQKT